MAVEGPVPWRGRPASPIYELRRPEAHRLVNNAAPTARLHRRRVSRGPRRGAYGLGCRLQAGAALLRFHSECRSMWRAYREVLVREAARPTAVRQLSRSVAAARFGDLFGRWQLEMGPRQAFFVL